MTQVLDLGCQKFALGFLGKELVLSERTQGFSEVFEVFFSSLAEDQNVVQVDHYPCVQIRPEYVVHEGLKRCWCIGEPERHDQEFEMSVSRPKCRLSNVLFTDSYLVISHPQVDFAEISGMG